MVEAALQGDFAKLLAGPHHDGLIRAFALTHELLGLMGLVVCIPTTIGIWSV